MERVWFILISVIIAASIGWVTNYLAIKMLFQPRKPWHWFRMRVPFTPGLIPKRKPEIAKSLGAIVSEYLVTSEGLASVIESKQFRSRLEVRLTELVEEWTGKDETVRQFVLRNFPHEDWEAAASGISEVLRDWTGHGVDWLWQKYGLSEVRIGQWLSRLPANQRRRLIDCAADWIMDAAQQQLSSVHGNRMIRNVVERLLDHVGGVMGMLAGIFIDVDKITGTIRDGLIDYISSESTREAVSRMIENQLDKLGNMRIDETASLLGVTESRPDIWLKEQLRRLPPWEDWINNLGEKKLQELLAPCRPWLSARVPGLTAYVVHIAANNVDRLIRAVDLPRLVESQVAMFPVERLEKVVLSVSGKEFRAITRLGALLGGMIGFVQAVLILWLYPFHS